MRRIMRLIRYKANIFRASVLFVSYRDGHKMHYASG